MTPEIAMKAGMAAGRLFTHGDRLHRVVIGKDTRLSGYMIESALMSGFTAVGMDAFLNDFDLYFAKLFDGLRRARRIGDEDDGAAAPAKPGQRVAGVGEGSDAVMHHAPDVAQHDIVARRQHAEAFGNGEWSGGHVSARPQG